MLSLSRILTRPLLAIPLCRFSAAAGGDGGQASDRGAGAATPQQQVKGRSIWATSSRPPAADSSARPRRPAPLSAARSSADAVAGGGSSSSGVGAGDSAAAVPRRTGSWKPGQEQSPRPSAAGAWRPGLAAAPPTPSRSSTGTVGGGGWRPMGDDASAGSASAMFDGGDMDIVSGGDAGRRRGGFAGRRRGGSQGGGFEPSWKKAGNEGSGNKFVKGRSGSRGGAAGAWGSTKERIDSVTGRENYFSALISAKRTTKVTKGGKTRTAQVRVLSRACSSAEHCVTVAF